MKKTKPKPRDPVGDLEKLIALLHTQPLTATEISIIEGCWKPAAYRRLRALKKKWGFNIIQKKARAGASGPKAVYYSLDVTAKSMKPLRMLKVSKSS